MTTEEKILLRARLLFIEKGISGSHMTDIASAAGINRRTLYRYFPTKEHLVCRLQVGTAGQLTRYYDRLVSHLKSRKGSSRIMEFFRLIDYGKVNELLYLQAQFDSHFAGSYPSEEDRRAMEGLLSPAGKGLLQEIRRGQEDGSISKSFPPEEIYTYLMEGAAALQNHIILRRSHLGKDWAGDSDFLDLFLKGCGEIFFNK